MYDPTDCSTHQVALVVKDPPADAREGDARDAGLVPASGRSPGRGNSNPLPYSCLEIPWTEEPGRLSSMGSQRLGRVKKLA